LHACHRGAMLTFVLYLPSSVFVQAALAWVGESASALARGSGLAAPSVRADLLMAPIHPRLPAPIGTRSIH
jgi:hypothetical protein